MPSDEELHECIAQMLLAMEGSYQDIWECHCYLVAEEALYLAVWEKLDAPFRARWKSYLDDLRGPLDEGPSLLGPFGPGVR